MKDPSKRIASWREKLQSYYFTIEHRSGVKHCNADALSRSFPQAEQAVVSAVVSSPFDLASFKPQQEKDSYCSSIIKSLQGDKTVTLPPFTYVSQFVLKDGLLHSGVGQGRSHAW